MMGWQNWNSLVKLTHLPTGFSTQSNGYRSQHRNRESAWQRLCGMLYLYGLKEDDEDESKTIFTYDLDRYGEVDDLFSIRKETKIEVPKEI